MKLHMMTHGDPHQYEGSSMMYHERQSSPYYQVSPVTSDYQPHTGYSGKYYDSNIRNDITNAYSTSGAVSSANDAAVPTYTECDSSTIANEELLLKVAEEQLRPLIKEELRHTIQSKRIAKGLPSHVDIEYKVPEPEPDTPATLFKRQRRRERNKLAAAKCRFKKKMLSDKLMEESYDLENQNQKLKNEVQRLQEERQKLMYILNLHRPTCIVRSPSITSPEHDMGNTSLTASSPPFGLPCHHMDSLSTSRHQLSPSSRTSSMEEDSNSSMNSVFSYPPYSQAYTETRDNAPVQQSVIVQSNTMNSPPHHS